MLAWDGYPGFTNLVTHSIDLDPERDQPIKAKQRPVNPLMEQSLREQIQTWQDHGVITESNSPWMP